MCICDNALKARKNIHHAKMLLNTGKTCYFQFLCHNFGERLIRRNILFTYRKGFGFPAPFFFSPYSQTQNPCLHSDFQFYILSSLYYTQDGKKGCLKENRNFQTIWTSFCDSDKPREVIEYWVHIRDEHLKSQFKKQLLHLIPTGDAQQFNQPTDFEDFIIVRKWTEQLFNENTFLPFFF